MDQDIRAALFEGFDEEGEFEELQDDFVMQVFSNCQPFMPFCCVPILTPQLDVYSHSMIGDERAL